MLRLLGEVLLTHDAKEIKAKAFRRRFATSAAYFSQRAKSRQKRFWVGLGDLPFGFPRIKSGAGSAMLGSSGGRSTHSANAPLRHTLPQIRLILCFSAASTAESSAKTSFLWHSGLIS
jgi:hypothetical protein